MQELLTHNTIAIPEDSLPVAEVSADRPVLSEPSVERVSDIGHRQAFGQAMRRAYHDGWIAGTDMHHMGRLMSTDVYADRRVRHSTDDRLELSLVYDAGEADTLPQYDIYVSPDEAKDRKAMYEKFLSVLSGEERTGEDQEKAGVPVARRGLEQVFGNGIAGQALNRAVVGRAAEGMLGGDIDDTDPAPSAKHGVKVGLERLMLQFLMEGGDSKVDVRLFTRAMFEDKAEADRLGDESAQASLARALHRAFPLVDVIADMTALSAEEGQDTRQVLGEYLQQLRGQVARKTTLPRRAAGLLTKRLAA